MRYTLTAPKEVAKGSLKCCQPVCSYQTPGICSPAHFLPIADRKSVGYGRDGLNIYQSPLLFFPLGKKSYIAQLFLYLNVATETSSDWGLTNGVWTELLGAPSSPMKKVFFNLHLSPSAKQCRWARWLWKPWREGAWILNYWLREVLRYLDKNNSWLWPYTNVGGKYFPWSLLKAEKAIWADKDWLL